MGSKRLCRFSMNEISSSSGPGLVKSMSERSFGNVVEELNPYLGCKDGGSQHARKVMVVVDFSREAKRALTWALTHALLKQDVLILLHVVSTPPPASPIIGNESPFPSMTPAQAKRHVRPCDSAALDSLKALCLQKMPEINVEVVIVGGQDKGAAILRQTKKRSVSLLVLGQPKPASLLSRLPLMCSDSRNPTKEWSSMVDYCIQNCDCMTVGVRAKSRRLGGYVISTRRHKNFWLLA